jgi:glycosyltransferase involved in cell wall biosynthesis
MTSDRFVAYVVQQFPTLRTTFIRREIESLRELGLRIEVFSMRRPDAGELNSEAEANVHQSTTDYMPAAPLSWESLTTNLWAAATRPVMTSKMWRLAAGDPGQRGVSRRIRIALQIWRGATLAVRIRRRGPCGHIHAHFADGAATTALVAAKLLDLPFSFTSHTSFDSPLLKEKISSAAFVASISEFDRRQLIAKAGQAAVGAIHIVHCGIKLDEWPFRFRLPAQSIPRLVSVGALIDKKGHDVLIEACRIMADEGVRFRCEIMGGGPLHSALATQITRSGLDGVVVLRGPQPQNVIRSAAYGADIFVLASKRTPDGDIDGLPVSLMEAMAAGCATISTRLAGIPELIADGGTGFLAEPGDASSLANAIKRTLSLPAVERQEMTRRARAHIETMFDQRREAKRLMELIRSDLALPRHDSGSALRAPQVA